MAECRLAKNVIAPLLTPSYNPMARHVCPTALLNQVLVQTAVSVPTKNADSQLPFPTVFSAMAEFLLVKNVTLLQRPLFLKVMDQDA